MHIETATNHGVLLCLPALWAGRRAGAGGKAGGRQGAGCVIGMFLTNDRLLGWRQRWRRRRRLATRAAD